MRHICSRSLTLKSSEIQAGLLVNALKKSINEVNDEDYLNVHTELQEEGVPVDDVEPLEGGDGQPDDATTGSQDDDTSFAFDFRIEQSLSPPRELALLQGSRIHQVFEYDPL